MANQIKPLRKYSQNFLQNKHIAEKIVDSLNCRENDIILEIGAGRGILTDSLINRKYRKLNVIEIDPRLINLLEEKYSNKLMVIADSVLNVSFEQLAGDNRLKVIGNIPYHITSDIIFKLIDNYKFVKCAVLMVQKEVANRLVAETRTKDYGILTIFSSLYGSVQKLFDVDRENFNPVPNVDSSIVKIEFDVSTSDDVDTNLLKKIVRAGFNARRKKLRNSLNKVFSAQNLEKISSVSLEKRPEELTIDEFKTLTKEISSNSG